MSISSLCPDAAPDACAGWKLLTSLSGSPSNENATGDRISNLFRTPMVSSCRSGRGSDSFSGCFSRCSARARLGIEEVLDRAERVFQHIEADLQKRGGGGVDLR